MTDIIIILILIIMLIEGLILSVMGKRRSLQQQTIDNQKYLNAYLQGVIVLQKGKCYRIEGDNLLIRYKEDGSIGAIEFIAGKVVFFQIGCVANFDKKTFKI